MATNGAAPIYSPQLDDILRQDTEQRRVPVHTFDPDAPPQAKAAAAGRARDKLDSVAADDRSLPAGKELKLDTGRSSAVPTITVEDHDKPQPKVTVPDGAQSPPPVEEDAVSNGLPGAMPTGPAPAIPDWYRVGWRQVSGIDDAPLTEGEERDRGILDQFLNEQFYGAWYHNAAVIVVAVFASHFLTRFGFGWGWLFILLAFCNTYYSTSMTRTRRHARDDIQRELVKTRLASEHESADWMNHFLERFWLIYEPVLSSTVISSVDQILSANTPPFLDSLRLTTFTLGTKAPRIDQVRTFPKTDDDIVMMDWGISFVPNDTSEMTQRQIVQKVNPKIVLSIRVGKGMATASMPILLEDITFSGLMRIRLKLMSNFPHVQVVDISFVEKPVIDYVLKPVGGETFGFDIANIPGLSTFIRDMTHGTLGPMMYEPNVFTLNLEQLLSGKPLDAAIGVLQVTVHSARGIKGTKIGGGTPDPYVSLTINDRQELARTKYKLNTYNPTWMETKFILVNSIDENLMLHLYDFNDHRKNTLLSSASFELAKLHEDSSHEGIISPLLKDGKERGELRYDITYYPVLEAAEGSPEVPDSSVGIVRLVLHQAKDLDQSKSMSGDLNPFAKVFIGNDTVNDVFATPRFKHTISPVWEAPYEFLCSDREASVITIKVIDDRDFLKDPVVGHMSIKLTDLMSCMGEAGRDWFPLSGCKSGRVRISAEWKPLAMAGSLHGLDHYKFPIGVVRLNIIKATDVKNVEATLGGKSDPYVRVMAANTIKGRTEAVNNNLSPVWDQILYIPVHSLKDIFLLECMDYQHLTRDRSLGTVELPIGELAKESDNPEYPYMSAGIRSFENPIRLDRGEGYKGTLTYTAEFVPALALKNLAFGGQGQPLANSDGISVRSGGSMSSSDHEVQAVPQGVTIKVTEKGNHRVTQSVDSKATGTSTGTGDGDNNAAYSSPPSSPSKKPEAPEEKGVELSIEEALSHQSGIVVFDIISGHIAKKSRLEVLLDNDYWPSFSTNKSSSTNAQWGYIGEGFIKEIDFSQIRLRLNEADEGAKEDIVGEWKGEAKSFLEKAIAGTQTITLTHDNDESTVMLEARYIPVPIKLEARESINNMGVLRVDLLDGQGIRGVDRSGKSDPYATFQLNGQKVFKSQTLKKTLTPEWNENFTCPVPSRVAADLTIDVWDWNQVEQDTVLGSARIEIADLEPFTSSERVLPLTHPKHGPCGQVRIRLVFHPEILAKSRTKTSTFSTAGRAVTQIGTLPVSAGKGVFQGVTNVFKRGDKVNDEVPPVPDMPSGQSSHPVGVPASMAAQSEPFPQGKLSTEGSPAQPGTLRVTVMDAKDLSTHETKAYVTLRVADKEQKTKHSSHKTAMPEWNESFIFPVSAGTKQIYAWIYDHKTLGKDKELASGEVDIWRHIQPQGISSAEVSVELRHSGLLRLRLEYDSTVNPSSGSSISSGEHVSRTSIIAPSRFSIRGRRPGTEGDD
ncbi:transmembrane protein [Macrolepiota fuliginosa MF-IS2]|uniref:Transmembrane protein n=1 Tax=Macrolepiota fuliginosa MF-IS2 TaxID=1400762 RepID=A0A9P6C852_9AGAR|nr:transmembrane protein [Macrolepiota fuliginosa MF-IS2]